MIQRYLAKPARETLNQAWQRNLPGKHRLARLAFKLAQAKAQAMAYKQRQNILRSDLRLDEALSFAGADTI